MTKEKQPNAFSKEHTLITKGILTIILLTHHVFYPDYITGYGINTILGDVKLVNRIMLYLKICIAGFAFLTAFGFFVGGVEQTVCGCDEVYFL